MEKYNKSLLTDATVAVTHKCNSKCIMCNIWKEKSENELVPADFLKLPAGLEDINVTGGEAFLRKDLLEIIENLTSLSPKVRLIISSNGFLTDRIIDYMQQARKINPKSCIGISLDGIDQMHDEIRGIEGAFNKVLATISGLKKSGINDIRVCYTGSDKNISHLAKVYDFAQEHNIEFTMSIVHNSENYFNIDTNTMNDVASLESQLSHVIKKELKYYNPRRLLRTYYLKGIMSYAKTGKRLLPCTALENSFFMNAQGDIYPCNILDTSIGNIREQDFNSIWNSDKKQKLEKYCTTCNKCWMVCTVKNSIRKQPFKVAHEVLADKLSALI